MREEEEEEEAIALHSTLLCVKSSVYNTRWMQRIVASEAIPVLTIRVGPCSLGHMVSDVNHTRVSRVNVPAGIYI